MRKPPRLASLVLGLVLVLAAIWRISSCATSPPSRLEALLAPSGSASAAPPGRSSRPRSTSERAAPRVPLLSASTTPDADATAGAFEGRVVSSATGRGIAGARLLLEHAGSTTEATCGEGGAFRFVPKEGASYALALVTADGYFPFAPEWDRSPVVWTARPGARVSGFVIALDPATPFTITVKNADGAPVFGAEVHVLDSGDRAHAGAPAAPAAPATPATPTTPATPAARASPTTPTARAAPASGLTTDANGEARAPLAPGALLEARHPAHAPGRTRVTLVGAASHTVTIHLGKKGIGANAGADGGAGGDAGTPESAGLAIAGRVIDASGAPVGGARIVASPSVENSAAAGADLHPVGGDVSDADGSFRVEGLDPGPHRVVATDDEHAPARAEDVTAGTEGLTLKVASGGTVRGVVRDPDAGKPVAAFSILVSIARGPLEREHLAARSFLDAEGRYEIEGLGPGAHEIVAVALGAAPSSPARVEITDPPGPPVTADLTLAKGASLRGTVLDAKTKAPIEGARVALEGALGASADVPLLATATAGADGTFELAGLAAGLRSLRITAAGHHGRIVSGVVIGASAPPPLTIELTPTEEGEEPGIELVGIGAVLTAKDDVLLVGQAIPGGGAAEVGLGAGDAILAIDGAPVVGLGFELCVDKIRGPEGSVVVLTVRKAGSTKAVDIPVPRRRIKG